MNRNFEQDYRRVVQDVGTTTFLPDSQIEIVRPPAGRAPRHVLFDFDGTLSLIREGWPEVMVPLMVEVLSATGTAETEEELSRLVMDFVMQLNGKQTIYQMLRLAEEVAERGGTPLDPLAYKDLYHERLMQRIGSRRNQLRRGEIAADAMLVPGSRQLLEALQARGVSLYLASGTDQQYVLEEADLLGLTGFFGKNIHGAVADFQSFSKAQVIQRILENNEVPGSELLGFGDGYVEIQNVKSVGGTAVAVASDERNRSGKPDLWKRERLVGVGADIVIPDFSEYGKLIAYLWSGPQEEWQGAVQED